MGWFHTSATEQSAGTRANMQIKVIVLFLILIQVVLLLVFWLHSTPMFLFNPVWVERLNGEVLNETLNATATQAAKPTDAVVVLPPCPETSPHLVGPIRVEFNWSWTMESVRADLDSSLLEGGRYKPPDCIAHHKVAIVIPFRNRHQHLIQWLYYLHPIMQRQQLDYGVYVINQDGEGTFNRAKLMNVGFAEAMKDNYTCFVFSDVDLIPLDDRNIYGCFDRPRHLSVAVDKFNFRLPYPNIFGGVVSFSKEQYLAVNGFPNEFWGWGGEDDDVFQRTAMKFAGVSRPDMLTGRYRMIKHNRDLHNEANPQNPGKLSRTASTMHTDGINSLAYTRKKIEKEPLYTFVTVDIGAPK